MSFSTWFRERNCRRIVLILAADVLEDPQSAPIPATAMMASRLPSPTIRPNGRENVPPRLPAYPRIRAFERLYRRITGKIPDFW